MDSARSRRLEAAGWKVGDTADFLDMDDVERQVLEARVNLALAIRRQRKLRHLSQKALGLRLGTTQPRVAKIERAASDVSLDQLMRAFAAVGGRIIVKDATTTSNKQEETKSARPSTLIVETCVPE